MEKQHISAIKIAMVYVGTVVGAGFATGQEILQFFVYFGLGGFWGILLSTLLFVGYGYFIMALGRRFAAKSHRELVAGIGGTYTAWVLDTFIMLSLFIALTAMMAGSGALFYQEFSLSPFVGSALMGVFTALTVLRGLKGVVNAISAVVPFLIVGVLAICVYALFFIENTGAFMGQIQGDSNILMGHWLFAALLYSGYNILMSASILAPMGGEASGPKSMFFGAAWGGILLGAVSLMIYLAIGASFAQSSMFEVPLLYLALQMSPVVGFLFSLILLAEVYTTAVSALYGFSARLGVGKLPLKTIVVGTVVLGFFLSLFGFSNFVRYFYPLQGYGGFVFLLVLLFSAIGFYGKKGKGN